MAKYDNSGSLFKNEEKTPETPNYADYQGSITVEGVDYFINGWLHPAREGKKAFMKLSVKKKEKQSSGSAPAASEGSADVQNDFF